jgi:hypothetical protein
VERGSRKQAGIFHTIRRKNQCICIQRSEKCAEKERKMAKRTGKRRRIRPNGNGIVVHMLANKGVCDCCGKEVDQEIFLPGMCDVHTHGMKKHGLIELQMVLEYPKEAIAYIINTVSDRIISGEIAEKDGTVIEGIFEDGAKIRLNECVDVYGEKVFRIMIPDGKFRMPEDSDEYPYNLQDKSPYIGDYNIGENDEDN